MTSSAAPSSCRTSPSAITERSQPSERQWRSIIESAVDGIIVIDSRGLVEAFNPAAERLFQYSESEVVGRNGAMLMSAPYCAEHGGYLSATCGKVRRGLSVSAATLGKQA